MRNFLFPAFLILSIIALTLSGCATTSSDVLNPTPTPTPSDPIPPSSSNNTVEASKSPLSPDKTVSVLPPLFDDNSFSAKKLYQQGIEDYNKDNFTQAAKKIREAAEQGYAEAQFKLASMYFDGKGVPQDLAQTAKWYHKAADQNHAEAQYLLAALYRFGSGVPKNVNQATKLYRRAAQQGNMEAQLSLGVMYYRGTEIRQNLRQAQKWLSLAAIQGNQDAEALLKEVNTSLTKSK